MEEKKKKKPDVTEDKLSALTAENETLIKELEESKKQEERAAARSSMVGSGARSEKIRTYNFPQDRVTDHRINYSAHNLPSFMMGEMDDMLDALNVYAKEEQLAADVTTLESNA